MRICIIGGGIVGLAAAHRIPGLLPGCRVTVLEKEAAFGTHQSTHNSGVLHAGLYYKPGSAKARLAVRGVRLMVDFCRRHGVAHEVCGKLVVAADASEVPRLRDLAARGQANGLRGIAWLEGKAIGRVEPSAGGVAALHVPEEGIVDYAAVVRRLEESAQEKGAALVACARATRFVRNGPGWVVVTPKGEFEADFIVNCAGLHCDRVSALAGESRAVRIVPFRGEYYKLKPERAGLVRNLIYPVPDPKYPFLGVHFTRLIRGGVEAGPNAILAGAREGYRKSDINPRDVLDAATFPGLWRFLFSNAAMCRDELVRSFSKRRFCRSLQRLVPDVREGDLEPGGSGVRAQAMTARGQLVQDFEFIERRNALHVLNAPSPAATASLAIGDEIALRVANRR